LSPEEVQKITSNSDTETFDFGRTFAGRLEPGDVAAFYGDLGSGKTTCIRGICAGLGSEDIVTSPTFTLINEYRGRLRIFHFDFYRLSTPEELHELGVEEYLNDDGICLIEWPEVVSDILPKPRYELSLSWEIDIGRENVRDIVVKRID
jgi:tRNA threonylcarbamoyladenosine biosynthesis protein TsaE